MAPSAPPPSLSPGTAREAAKPSTIDVRAATTSAGDTGRQRRIGLVGCVKQKAISARPAQDLYVSELFRGRRAYVERSCDEWWILSAKHGLVHPQEILGPYDETLKGAGSAARRRWSREVLLSLVQRVTPVAGDGVEIHAGVEYRDFGLVQGLAECGFRVVIPTEGMSIGVQLAFYKHSPLR
jgi:hypothetical protein